MQLQENGSPQAVATSNSLQTTSIEEISPKADNSDQIKSPSVNSWNQIFSKAPVWAKLTVSIVTITLSSAPFVFTIYQHNSSTNNQRQEAMSDYFDRMTDLMLDKAKFGEFEENSSARLIARTKTLSTLRQLDGDGERKGQVLKFLYEAELIGWCTINLTKLQLDACKGNRVNLSDAKLDRTTFEQLNLRKIDLAGINLEGASLAYARLPEVGLAGAKMQDVKLNGANLRKAYLVDAQMSRAILTKADLIDVELQRAYLEGAFLNDANLSGANLQQARLHRAGLENATLDNAILRGADLRDAILKGASLKGANLQEADLRNANLQGASLQGVNLQGAIYNDRTQFGDFNPEGRGMNRRN